MAEEHRCQALEGHRLCANSCRFFGSPATINLCSKCYRDFCLKEQQEASIKSTVEASLSASVSPSVSSSSSSSLVIDFRSLPPPPLLTLPEVTEAEDVPTVPEVAVAAVSQPNQCDVCRKRVGLTEFKCKCGTTFCGIYRYPEKHACSFDFKTVGKEEIARSNPLIKAEKLEKI
ncbi:PREDICTED: zinc finger A20 and AN1 domain-containing stress-associated protein 6-like [Fragaria vesca subsp. vesca]|uniref:zinc finger A20 and AN1 domain-containing stress-associated protein 6-like n=1 Tax=Fragaria vesca subsp. vesca TaxID=101020 RepID=UPI0002C32776|nr:PREDICTED: zinc finger A20 and AN1 domain-containing stress-associated protein 6-like [Fragaria vesca subsp. vesca]